jgi:muconolactone delta-isomerase
MNQQKEGGTMKFLILTSPKHLVPPEVLVKAIEAMAPWQERHKAKFVAIWGNAGTQGGGGVVDVDTVGELDALMTEFPLQGISDIKITPLVDLEETLTRALETLRAQAGG